MWERVRPGHGPLTPCSVFFPWAAFPQPCLVQFLGVITLQKGQRFDWPTGATLRSDDGGTKQMTSDLTLSVARKREQQTKNGLQTKN